MNYNDRIKPNTEFVIYHPSILTNDDIERLNHLYLPIIGLESSMVYLYFHHLKNDDAKLTINLHHTLLDGLGTTLSMLQSSIEKLEAVGLIKTYQSKKEHDDLLIYELQVPLYAADFFNDTILSFYLHRKIGNDAYKQRLERFSYPDRPLDIVDISKTFDEVFDTKELESVQVSMPNQRRQQVSTGVNIDPESFDFEVLFTHLKGTQIDRQFFDKKTRLLIAELAILFNLNAYDIKLILMESTSPQFGIDKRKLKQNARKFYQREHKNKGASNKSQSVTGDGYFDKLETINPLDRIATVRQRAPHDEDLKIITELLTSFSFTYGAINVLLEYVYQQLDGKLPYNYVMTIANKWYESGVTDAQDALKEIQSFKSNHEKSKSSKVYSKKDRPGEVRPDWMDEPNDEKQEESKTTDDVVDDEFDELMRYFKKGE